MVSNANRNEINMWKIMQRNHDSESESFTNESPIYSRFHPMGNEIEFRFVSSPETKRESERSGTVNNGKRKNENRTN